jgi:hypothetical protein
MSEKRTDEQRAEDYVCELTTAASVTETYLAGLAKGRSLEREKAERLVKAVKEYVRERTNIAPDYTMRKIRFDNLQAALAALEKKNE